MKANLDFLLFLCLLGTTVGQDYEKQGQWGGDCQAGKQQSPIDIITQTASPCLPGFSFQITSKDETYTQIPYDPQNQNIKTPFTLSTITFTNGASESTSKTYNSIQFHFHHQSEHLLNHQRYDLELHVLHQADDQSNAVFSILFKAEPQGILQDPFDSWQLDTTIPVQQKFPINLATPRSVFHYKGSLTTPACNEGVQWFVNEEVIPMKEENLVKVARLINKGNQNNRSVQELNGRQIIELGSVCSNQKRTSIHRLRINQ